MWWGGASRAAGCDLCQVAVSGAPRRAHIRPHLSPISSLPPPQKPGCMPGQQLPPAARGSESPDRPRSYLRRTQHLAGPRPSWTTTPLTDINGGCRVSSQISARPRPAPRRRNSPWWKHCAVCAASRVKESDQSYVSAGETVTCVSQRPGVSSRLLT